MFAADSRQADRHRHPACNWSKPATGDRLPVDFAEAFEAARDRLAPLCRQVLYFDRTGSTNDGAGAAEAGDAEGWS